MERNIFIETDVQRLRVGNTALTEKSPKTNIQIFELQFWIKIQTVNKIFLSLKKTNN